MPAAAVHSILLKKENAHEDPIYCCAWTRICTTDDPNSPAKEFILSGGLDGLLKVWTIENNKLDLVHTLAEHSMAVVSVAVSPDGHSIASSSLDSTLIIWDLLSGNKVHEVETSATDVWKVTFSPDGKQVATGSHTGKVIIYEIRNGKMERTLDTRGKFVLCVAWSPDSRYIGAGAVDGTVCLFDAAQGKLMHTIEAHRSAVRSIAFSPNSKLLITGSDDGTAKLYDVASANLQASLEHKSWVVCCVFSPEGARVATSTSSGSVRVATVDGLTVLNTFREHTDTVWGLQFNAKGNKLLSVAKDKCINVYECPVPPKNLVKK